MTTQENGERSLVTFDDGVRKIDFVLVYRNLPQNVTDADGDSKKRRHQMARESFESELTRSGLQLECDVIGKSSISSDSPPMTSSSSFGTTFVKIHATWDALSRQAELLRLQMPIKECDLPAKSESWIRKLFVRLFGRNPFDLKHEFKLNKTEMFTDVFDRRREDTFLFPDFLDKSSIFSQAQRISLTWDILSDVAITLPVERKKKSRPLKVNKVHNSSTTSFDQTGDRAYLESSKDTMKTVDIRYLLKQQIYTAAYPVHDGTCDNNSNEHISSKTRWSLREYLHKSWAKFGQWYSYQPLDEIRDYFGEKMAIYFAWLGFYTKMLILPAVVGLLSFLFGLCSLLNAPLVNDFCENQSNFTAQLVCPLCQVCPTDETIGRNCFQAKLNTVFDNESTVFFSVFVDLKKFIFVFHQHSLKLIIPLCLKYPDGYFRLDEIIREHTVGFFSIDYYPCFFMAIWAVLFLEFWKRRQAELCVRWDVSDAEFSEEKIRIEYKLNVSSTKLNPITKSLEPYLPASTKCRRLAASILGAAFFVFVVLALLAAVMIYKIAGPLVWRQILNPATGLPTVVNPQLMSSVTASVANGIFIAIMTKIYISVAWNLTNVEYPRTESDFEYSYTYKIFIFQFVNFYGALFYLAFVRGKFLSAPNQAGRWEARCPITGCLLDISIQLAVIMVGKQALNNVMEIGIPKFRNWWRRRKSVKTAGETNKQWRTDLELDPVAPLNLSDDYLEMLIQYGFVTMFVAAFPLAPLFALLNNVVEIRLDAKKHLLETRRCIPMRAKDLGPWYSLLDAVTKIAILTNGLLIAFATGFVDRLVYSFLSADRGRFGYANHVLSLFDPNDYADRELAANVRSAATTGGNGFCFYRDYRNPPGEGVGEKYEPTTIWWTVLVAKLVFVFIFEHFVIILQSLVAYVIPDVPDHVTLRQQREQHVQREMFMEQERFPPGGASA